MRQSHFLRGTAVVLLVLAACAPAGRPDPAQTDNPTRQEAVDGALATSLHVERMADSVRFTLRVTNPGRQPVPLTFSSGQSFDFVVERDGRPLWRWSDDMMFTQAIRQETLAPEATRTYSATWVPRAPAPGRYVVRGRLTAQEHATEQRAEFQLP